MFRINMNSTLNASGFAFFRLFFFSIVTWEALRYLSLGRVQRYYAEPSFFFKYYGFEWVHPLGERAMLAVFLALGAVGAAAALGLFYRLTSLAAAVLLSYIFLLDQTRYLNHFYLITLVAWLLAFMPANRFLALDTRLRLANPSPTVPAWTYWTLRVQLILVYLFAGIAKINPDWLAGEPIGPWLQKRHDLTLLGGLIPLGEWISRPEAGRLFAWGGIAIDLCVPILLLIPRTRWIAVVASLGFHLLNDTIFNIGVFPWFMLAATTIFFNPSWPRRFFRLPEPPTPPLTDRPSLKPASQPTDQPGLLTRTRRWPQNILIASLALFFTVQLTLPLRHWLYPGDVAWTEEGHRFSWRMKLRDKSAGGYFQITDPATGRRWRADISDYLTPAQARAMWPRPDMVLQLAHEIARREEARLGRRPEVRAVVRASLNHRPSEFLLDPAADLAQVKRSLLPADWIVPHGFVPTAPR